MPKCFKCGAEPDEEVTFCPECGTFLLHKPAFIALEKELSNNPLFVAWKKSSIFEQLVGPPRILYREFSGKWIQSVTKLLGDGPLALRYLANLGTYIEEIRSIHGYQNIKSKLEKMGEDFFPTLSEIEWIDFLFYYGKLQPSRIHLEHTFETSRGKHPELKVDYNSKALYFEVTRIMDYKEMSSITSFYNIITAFQLSMKSVRNKRVRVSITFKSLPDQDILEKVIRDINEHGSKFFEVKKDDYKINVSEGDEVVISIPPAIFENKIKDKMDEKTKQFEENALNFIVLDVTSVVLDLDELSRIVREYFVYSNNTIISGVFLLSKKWTIENLNLEYKLEIVHQPNLNRKDRDAVVGIVRSLFTKPDD